MAEITCPECGLVTSMTSIRRAADEFCAHCDYPLFWAPSALPLAVGTTASESTLRRLPGAGGRMLIGSHVCPACGELNPMAEVWCLRCGAPLHPVAEEPPPPPPPLPPPPEPEPVRNRWWLWLLLAVAAGLLTATGIIVWG